MYLVFKKPAEFSMEINYFFSKGIFFCHFKPRRFLNVFIGLYELFDKLKNVYVSDTYIPFLYMFFFLKT